MKINPLTCIDFYKSGHRQQYPAGTELVVSNLTPRSGKYATIPNQKEIIFFGLQYFIKNFLMEIWNQEFFKKSKEEVVKSYKRRMDNALGKDAIPVDHIEALHDLGYLPICIKALPEGSIVPIGIPCLTIHNTKKEFFWLTNYLETILSTYLWLGSNSATIAWNYKQLVERYAGLTGAPKEFTNFQCHDFSFRGMSSLQSACLSGAGHLLFFKGTDTVPAIDFLEEYYGANSDNQLVGCSVPATEHSVMCMGGDGLNELATFDRLITGLYPKGIVSIVSDTWDFWKVIGEYSKALKNKIIERQGKVVFRPDCYDDQTQILTNSGWKYFNDLTGDDKVAEVLNDGSYRFVKPIKRIKQEYNGDMIQFQDFHGKIDLLVTPNHRMVCVKDNKIKIENAADISLYWGKDFVRSARAKNQSRHLSDLERLKIAFQADGSFCTDVKSSIRFSFSKERKINRLISILERMDLEYHLYDLKDGKKEFNIKINASLFSKDFDWIDISDLCSCWCSEFIEELSNWDSHARNENKIKFDTTNKDVIKIVELIAISAGYGVLISEYEDNRKVYFSDVYTAHILKNNTFDGQSVQKVIKNYNGYVYCVQVSSGMLLVKRNKCVAVCGNSGDPVKIICGDPDAPKGSPEYYGAVHILWDIFGGQKNEKGFKELHPNVGLIYGDSITYERAEAILDRLYKAEFASSNIVFGVGSYTYQYNTRDTFGWAVKATYGEIQGQPKNIFKKPKTDDGTKNSAKGLIIVRKDKGRFVMSDEGSWKDFMGQNALDIVFYDGVHMKGTSLSEIRNMHGLS